MSQYDSDRDIFADTPPSQISTQPPDTPPSQRSTQPPEVGVTDADSDNEAEFSDYSLDFLEDYIVS